MHVLFVTSLVPDGNPTTGYEIANKAIIDGLVRLGVKVTVLGFIWPGSKPADPAQTIVLGEVDVRNETAGILRKIGWIAKAFATGLTVSSVKLRVVSRRDLRAAMARAEPFDFYMLNGVPLSGTFEDCFNDRPQMFVAHNVEHRSAAENAQAAASRIQKFLFGREARLLAGLERRLCDRAAFVFTLAEEDIAALGLAGSDKAAALPLATGTVPPRQGPRRIERDIGLIGTWTWQPNRIGLEWFLREVAPHLDPQIRVTVAGATPADLKAAWPKVEFAGRVPDAKQFVLGSAVIPLISRAGTGVQLKTIETFELGLPSVATSLSVRGIAGVPENCAVADDPRTFAAAVNRLVARSRSGENLDCDGTSFHAAQVERLDAQLRLGLARLEKSS
ncbi:glycosyltransferase family 4 protein [Phyllobacterium sp. 0TCS1.6C]|uniref:glycosyltransferase n=1 Tax=unclassified Phyllobacterium TaxID=2638441 RepID=UPI002264A2E9|nr:MULTISPECIES: glycosyltransferase family 4 protein [unclassified Phyllobacterium]MCX8281996.1 glycosyltransferase family 4 protein [Phyllobacterium sp. 0TCS1.6C]MCX8294459.1 glycosyltransferase family 4 protein [Phyllobacterium sp. 0TCS1.6A]